MPISTIGSNSLNQTSDLTINGVTVGEGGGSVSSNTAVGASAMAATATGQENSAFGNSALKAVTSGQYNTGIGYFAFFAVGLASGAPSAPGSVTGSASART